MQKLIFVLIIAGVSAAPRRNGQPIPGYECPQEDIDNTGCKGPKDCLYPNPKDCHSFIQCNDGGLAYEMPCAADLVYNDTLKECDYPENTECSTDGEPSTTEGQGGEPSTEAPTNAPTDKPTEKPTEEPSEAPTDKPTEKPTEAPSEAPTDKPTERPTTEQASSTEGSGSGSDFVCPEEDIAETACKGPKDCLYPNPESCDNFIQCTVNADGVTGTPVVMPCPEGLQWNDNKKECDYPAQSTCSNGGSTSRPSEAPTTAAPTEEPSEQPSTQEPSNEPSTQAPSSERPSTAAPTEEPSEAPTTEEDSSSTSGSGSDESNFVCPKEDIEETACKGPKDCLYPNPESCNNFIQCTVNADGVTGTPVVMPCPAGLEWNDNKKECDYPHDSTCPDKGSTAGTSEATASSTSGYESTTPEASTPEAPAESTTEAQSDSTTESNESTTGAETSTTEQSESTTLPVCRPDDDDSEDEGLDLEQLCQDDNCKKTRRTVAHPSNTAKYILCGEESAVRRCSPGLLWSTSSLSCDYAGLVSPNGPSRR